MSVKVKLENKTIEVKKLPLKKYAELLKCMNTLPVQLSKMENLGNDEVIKALPEMLSESYDDLAGMLEIATGLTREEVDELGLDEVADLLVAVFTVNKYAEVYEKIKKGLARRQNQETSKN